jgi:ABC-2 type transport system permease protein
MFDQYKDLFKWRELISVLVLRDIKVKYRGSIFGYLWSLLNPLFIMLTMSVVLSYFFRFQIDYYPIYLLTGQVIFNFFSEASNLSMTSIIQGGGLIKKVYFPREIFPISRVLSSLVNLVFSLVAVIIVIAVTKVPLHLTIFFTPLVLIYVTIFSMGVGLALSAITVFFRDTIHIYGVLLNAWMYFTPIFYPADLLPNNVLILLKFNPLFHYIEYFRFCVLYGKYPTLQMNIVCVLISLLSLFIGALIFKRTQDRFVLYI